MSDYGSWQISSSVPRQTEESSLRGTQTIQSSCIGAQIREKKTENQFLAWSLISYLALANLKSSLYVSEWVSQDESNAHIPRTDSGQGRDKKGPWSSVLSCQIGACRAVDVNTVGTTASGVECAGADSIYHSRNWSRKKWTSTQLHLPPEGLLPRTHPVYCTPQFQTTLQRWWKVLSYKFQMVQ